MSNRASKKYINAFIAVVRATSSSAKALESIKILGEILAQKQIKQALKSHGDNQCLAVLADIIAENTTIKIDQPLINLLKLIATNKRTDLLPEIISGIKDTILDVSNKLHITTAKSISDDTKKSILKMCDFVDTKNKLIQWDIDTDIVGGIIVRDGLSVYDGSYRSRMNNLKNSTSLS